MEWILQIVLLISTVAAVYLMVTTRLDRRERHPVVQKTLGDWAALNEKLDNLDYQILQAKVRLEDLKKLRRPYEAK